MDISGEKYNKLLALEFFETDKSGNSVWKCMCDCGEFSYVRLGALRAGQIKQCKQCHNAELTKNHIENDRLRSIYRDMLRRCYEPQRKAYHRYGGRGIEVCEEWLNNPVAFEKWSLDNGYSSELTIDRVENNGDYEPSNCRWVDMKTQNNNINNNVVLEYKGVKLTLTQWAEKLNVHTHTLRNRIENGEHEDVVFSSKDVRQQKSKSGIKGISWSKRSEKWQVRVRVNGERIHVGAYSVLDSAIYALDLYKSTGEKISEEEIQ